MDKISTAAIDQIVVLDKKGLRYGTADKMQVHQNGELHEAFSIFIWDNYGKIVLQQRAFTKYHSGGLWADTCSGHPKTLDEESRYAAGARLLYESGLDCILIHAFDFRYNEPVGNGLRENELDRVYVGRTSLSKSQIEKKINRNEIAAIKLFSLATLRKDVNRHPERYAVWDRIIIKEHFDELKNAYQELKAA